jgi:hypothetical protein
MYEDRVEKGAALLDRARPGWEREVSPQALLMCSGCDCVLGQLYGHFLAGIDALGVDGRKAAQVDHGFYLPPGGPGLYRDLSDAWRALIRRRTATAT